MESGASKHERKIDGAIDNLIRYLIFGSNSYMHFSSIQSASVFVFPHIKRGSHRM